MTETIRLATMEFCFRGGTEVEHGQISARVAAWIQLINPQLKGPVMAKDLAGHPIRIIADIPAHHMEVLFPDQNPMKLEEIALFAHGRLVSVQSPAFPAHPVELSSEPRSFLGAPLFHYLVLTLYDVVWPWE